MVFDASIHWVGREVSIKTVDQIVICVQQVSCLPAKLATRVDARFQYTCKCKNATKHASPTISRNGERNSNALLVIAESIDQAEQNCAHAVTDNRNQSRPHMVVSRVMTGETYCILLERRRTVD